jgi:hypothetical protein
MPLCKMFLGVKYSAATKYLGTRTQPASCDGCGHIGRLGQLDKEIQPLSKEMIAGCDKHRMKLKLLLSITCIDAAHFICMHLSSFRAELFRHTSKNWKTSPAGDRGICFEIIIALLLNRGNHRLSHGTKESKTRSQAAGKLESGDSRWSINKVI